MYDRIVAVPRLHTGNWDDPLPELREMAAALSTSRPAMSRHLRVLRRAGLVEEDGLEADARARIYQLCREPFAGLRVWLDEVEAFWDVQLRAFKAHAERRQGRRRP